MVGLVLAQDLLQVGLVPDEGAVQELAAASADPAFGGTSADGDGAAQPSPGRPCPSLIPSLIHLSPDPFGAHHLDHAAQVANPFDLARTQPRRLGRRVGGILGKEGLTLTFAVTVRQWLTSVFIVVA